MLKNIKNVICDKITGLKWIDMKLVVTILIKMQKKVQKH